MDKLEKVIKGLECCLANGHNNCPYESTDEGIDKVTSCTTYLMRDALALLKAQQPRVLNLNEIHRGMVVWLEQYKVPEMLLVIGGSSADGQKCFITEDYRSITPYDEDYNEYWRAWTQEPTNEQRKAVKWDD